MKRFFYFMVFTFFLNSAKSQLTKGNWLVGGTGKLYSYNSTYSSVTSPTNIVKVKYTQIDISASVGYFVADRLAFGIRPTLSSFKESVTNIRRTNIQRYWFGPFGRYYLLSAEKQYNIVTDISYQLGVFEAGGQKGNLNTFSALVGPVIYFNTSVGIEFLLGYSYSKEDVEQGNKEIRKGFQMGIGFQIHLEK